MRSWDLYGAIFAVNLTGRDLEARRVPVWAATLFARVPRDLPRIVTLDDVAGWLQASGTARDAESAVRELRRLGWLKPLPVQGAWAFIPAGYSSLADPYLGLRGLLAVDPRCGVMLAGAAPPWHLGCRDCQRINNADTQLNRRVRWRRSWRKRFFNTKRGQRCCWGMNQQASSLDRST